MLKKQLYIISLLFSLTTFHCFSQKNVNLKIKDSLVAGNFDFNPLSPAKAAFYSAILPGLGQAYNKKYWKIPFVYAALGTGIYTYNSNNTNYNRVRNAYKLRLNDKPDEFDGLGDHIFLSDAALTSAQKSYKKDKDLSLLVTVGLYLLQVIEASANAHLLQHNVDDNLSFTPQIIHNSATNKSIVGASLNIKF